MGAMDEELYGKYENLMKGIDTIVMELQKTGRYDLERGLEMTLALKGELPKFVFTPEELQHINGLTDAQIIEYNVKHRGR